MVSQNLYQEYQAKIFENTNVAVRECVVFLILWFSVSNCLMISITGGYITVTGLNRRFKESPFPEKVYI